MGGGKLALASSKALQGFQSRPSCRHFRWDRDARNGSLDLMQARGAHAREFALRRPAMSALGSRVSSLLGEIFDGRPLRSLGARSGSAARALGASLARGVCLCQVLPVIGVAGDFAAHIDL